jgi:hypothetical protein
MEFLIHIILIWMVINFVVLAIVVEKDFRRIHSNSRRRSGDKPVLQRENVPSSRPDITGAPNE